MARNTERQHTIDLGNGRRIELTTDGETFRVVAERRERLDRNTPRRILQFEAAIDWDEDGQDHPDAR